VCAGTVAIGFNARRAARKPPDRVAAAVTQSLEF
jgi:hypothetical protein